MPELVLFCGAWFLAGFINNLAGFGAAMVAMPIIATTIPLEVAVPSSSLIVLTLNLQLGWTHRQHINWKPLRLLFAGGLFGSIAGLLVMQSVPNATLKFVMGLLLIAYGIGSLFHRPSDTKKRFNEKWGVVAGFMSTLLGALFGFNGPPLAVYTSMGGWDQQAAKGILGACFIVTGLIIVMGQLTAGIQTMQTVTYYALGCPAVLLGGAVGIYASRFVPQAVYRKVVLVLILAAGMSVIYSSI